MNPDEIPLWFAIPASIVLCIAWRRQVVLERRAHCSIADGRVVTGASATLRASLTGECPAQRIHDSKADRVTDIVHRSVVTEKGRAECHRCGRVVGVTRRWDDGRWGWSPWRYDTHKPGDPS